MLKIRQGSRTSTVPTQCLRRSTIFSRRFYLEIGHALSASDSLISEDQTMRVDLYIPGFFGEKRRKTRQKVGPNSSFSVRAFYLVSPGRKHTQIRFSSTWKSSWVVKLRGPVGIVIRWGQIVTFSVTTSLFLSLPKQCICPSNWLLFRVGGVQTPSLTVIVCASVCVCGKSHFFIYFCNARD